MITEFKRGDMVKVGPWIGTVHRITVFNDVVVFFPDRDVTQTHPATYVKKIVLVGPTDETNM